jgi:hypothetical protein
VGHALSLFVGFSNRVATAAALTGVLLAAIAVPLGIGTAAGLVGVAGGVALNSVMNGRILLETPFEEFFAQPASADDGSALGAALHVGVSLRGAPRPTGGYIFTCPQFTDAEIEQALRDAGLEYSTVDDIAARTAQRVADGKIVGWMQGRMECGPRALGNRSLLADPRDAASKARMNEKVKHREPFRRSRRPAWWSGPASTSPAATRRRSCCWCSTCWNISGTRCRRSPTWTARPGCGRSAGRTTRSTGT